MIDSGDKGSIKRKTRATGGVGSARLTGLIIKTEAGRLKRSVGRGVRAVGAFKLSVPDRLLIAPQDIRTADPTIAADIYAGHLVFGGSFVDAHGQSPFDLTPPSSAWAEALHGFGWLRHLRAADTTLSKANARALVHDWIVHGDKQRGGVAWQPEVATRRLLAWLSQSPVILATTDGVFYRQFMRSVGRHAAFLQRAIVGGLSGERRLFAAIALAECGLCADGLAGARKLGTRVMVEELNRQILPDGGHISRNPSVLVDLLLDALPLRQAFAARSAPVPPALLNAIDRMMPMLRLFRTGNGSLALFNGMGVTQPDTLSTLLTYDDAQSRPLTSAPHSGYHRLQAGDTVVICDVAKPPPRAYSERANAGTLSFELTAGLHRLIVNCGRPTSRVRQTLEAARSTAAHSTLVLDDTSSSRFASIRMRRWLGEQIVSGPNKVEVSRDGNPSGSILVASHDGYAAEFSLLHRRRLVLSTQGNRLIGEDTLLAPPKAKPGPARFDLRFHLAPGVRAEVSRDGISVVLTLPDLDRWVFEAGGMPISIEESIFFAAAEGARRTSQITVAGRYPEQSAVAWSLARLVPARP